MSEDKLETDQKFFENKIWSIRDTAGYTGYAVGTLYNLVSQNLVPHRKKRGRLFFIPLEIQNWIEEGN
jgi:predicted DNA-binding transcriptional regulator AlpA